MADKWKMVFGFSLLGSIDLLATIISLAHVEEKTSFGLLIILGCLVTLSGGFAVWAFTVSSKEP